MKKKSYFVPVVAVTDIHLVEQLAHSLDEAINLTEDDLAENGGEAVLGEFWADNPHPEVSYDALEYDWVKAKQPDYAKVQVTPLSELLASIEEYKKELKTKGD